MVVFRNGASISNYGFQIQIGFVDQNSNPISLTACSNAEMIFVYPDGATTTACTASLSTNSISFTITQNLFPVAGNYSVYGHCWQSVIMDLSTALSPILVTQVPGNWVG